MTLSAKDVMAAEQPITEADFVVAQLEIPIEAIEQAFKIAKANGVTTVLNPAPAIDLPKSLLTLTDIIIPNETEAAITEADFVVAQLEIPIEAIEQAFKIAKANGVTTVLNPAPAIDLPKSLLTLTDIIIPNETEAELLSGISITNQDNMKETVEYFFKLGISTILITLGNKVHIMPLRMNPTLFHPKVEAIDTTAAGDTFIGAFVSQLNKDLSNLEQAIQFANQASSLTVQRQGAQAAIPTRDEVINVYK